MRLEYGESKEINKTGRAELERVCGFAEDFDLYLCSRQHGRDLNKKIMCTEGCASERPLWLHNRALTGGIKKEYRKDLRYDCQCLSKT